MAIIWLCFKKVLMHRMKMKSTIEGTLKAIDKAYEDGKIELTDKKWLRPFMILGLKRKE